MLTDILNKILLILFLMSTFNVIRHLYYFVQAWVKSDSDNPVRYILSNKSLYVLSISLAYVIAVILTCKIYI
jgi:hypothetical protein